ncbi:MAG: phosphatidate cytidylyltransferase [Planctomycetia bacterium]
MTARDPTSPPTSGAFASRLAFAGGIMAAFAALAWADWRGLGGAQPSWWLLPVAIVLAVGGVDERVRLFAARNVALSGWLLRPAVVAVVLSAAAGAEAFASSMAAASPTAAIAWSAVVVIFAVIVLFLVEIAGYRPHGGAIERLAAGTLTVVLLGLPLACLVSLRLLCRENLGPEQTGPGHLGMLPLVSLVVVAKAGDIAAYLGGSLFGRNRMAPTLSPGKTWEGAAAALVGSLAAAWVVLDRLGTPRAAGPWGGWLVFGLCVGLAAMAGDLAESLLKRECGAKDSGRSLGGLGGFLDLVDSLLFAAPVAWLLWVVGGR